MDKQMAVTDPPYDLAMEQHCLGTILRGGGSCTDYLQYVTDDLFHDPRHQAIVRAVLAVRENSKDVDLVSILGQLDIDQEREIAGGIPYLQSLDQKVLPNASNALAVVAHLDDFRLRRFSVKLRTRPLKATGQEEYECLMKEISGAQRFRIPPAISMAEAMELTLKEIDQGHVNEIAVGLKGFDRQVGARRGDLVMVGGRTSSAKTVLGLNFARGVVERGGAALVHSLEMSAPRLLKRMLAHYTGVENWKIQRGRVNEYDKDAIGKAATMMLKQQLFIRQEHGKWHQHLAAYETVISMHPQIEVLIVDYIGLIHGVPERERHLQLGVITRDLKNLAGRRNILVIGLSQLNRKTTDQERPTLENFRESGCLSAETLVLMADGTHQPIEALCGKTKIPVVAYDETSRSFKQTYATGFSTGNKVIYEIILHSGRKIKATGNHKFLTPSGRWEPLEALNVGSALFQAPVKILPLRKSSKITENDAAFLGHLIGDGCVLNSHAIQYTTRERELANLVKGLAYRFSNEIRPRISPERTWFQVYLPSIRKLTKGRHNPIQEWFISLGIENLRSHQKFIPDIIFQSNQKVVRSFLSHLWATDGHISGKENLAFYASSSERLAYGVRDLLLRFGIRATVMRKDQGKKGRDQFHVSIWRKRDLQLFISKIGTVGKRREKLLQGLRERLRGTKNNAGTRAINGSISQCVDYVKSIKKIGVERVYDLEVQEHHNFIANNILVHNSIEQDSDVCVLIYAPEFQRNKELGIIAPEKLILDIAKHRDGNVGELEVYLDRRYCRILDFPSEEVENEPLPVEEASSEITMDMF